MREGEGKGSRLIETRNRSGGGRGLVEEVEWRRMRRWWRKWS